MGLLSAEMIAASGKDTSRIYRDVTEDLGVAYSQRSDATATPELKAVLKALAPNSIAATELAGETIEAQLDKAPGNGQPISGIKVIARCGRFAARPSGTEDVYKIYAESFLGDNHLRQIQRDAQAIVGRLI